MLSKIALLSFIFAVCDSQEHLTCLRTDEIISPSSAQPAATLQQGSPGKRGPIGAKGSIGQKGSKGDPGLSDNSMIDSLRDEVMSLRQQIQNITADLYRGYKMLDDGWLALFNGYQYKIITTIQSWESTRSICRNFGGDLAVFGIQSMETRWILFTALNPRRTNYWIGLNDQGTEGAWFWVNGQPATNAAIFWLPNQPDNFGNNEDCGELLFNDGATPLVNDRPCRGHLRGICERPMIEN